MPHFPAGFKREFREKTEDKGLAFQAISTSFVLMSINGLADVQSDLAPCAAET